MSTQQQIDIINSAITSQSEFIASMQPVNRTITSRLSSYKKDLTSVSEQTLKTAVDVNADKNQKVSNFSDTITSVLSDCSFSLVFYEDKVKSLHKKASYISDTIPMTTECNGSISFEIIIRNNGIFYSWTSEKEIYLKVEFIRSDDTTGDDVYKTVSQQLNLSDERNIPGIENNNADFEVNKYFDFTNILMNIRSGEYSIVCSVYDSDEDLYMKSTIHNITITA